ncbi:hypothetical protein N7526_004106, partial [Penicillium atrosanguineum]
PGPVDNFDIDAIDQLCDQTNRDVCFTLSDSSPVQLSLTRKTFTQSRPPGPASGRSLDPETFMARYYIAESPGRQLPQSHSDDKALELITLARNKEELARFISPPRRATRGLFEFICLMVI